VEQWRKNINGFIRSEREPAVPQDRLGTTSSRTIPYKENTRMTRKMIFLTVAFLLLASPIFAQPQGGGGGLDLNLPFAYLAVGIASGLCGLGQGKVASSAAEAMARNPGAQAGIRFALILGLVLIESLALYALVVTYIAKYVPSH
jgi:F-type H+-transporting ATPase subunit c